MEFEMYETREMSAENLAIFQSFLVEHIGTDYETNLTDELGGGYLFITGLNDSEVIQIRAFEHGLPMWTEQEWAEDEADFKCNQRRDEE